MISETEVTVDTSSGQTSNALTPVLYSFRRCPYAIRARMALHAARVVYAHREVELARKPLHLQQLSPKATVPVLWLPGEGGRVIDESLQIMQWALEAQQPHPWLELGERAEQAQTLIENNDTVFKFQLDRFKYPSRFGLSTEESIQFRDTALKTLGRLESLLRERPFLSGAHFGLTDAAIAPFVRQFAAVNPPWFYALPYKSLHRWLIDFQQSDLFKRVMGKFPVWVE